MMILDTGLLFWATLYIRVFEASAALAFHYLTVHCGSELTRIKKLEFGWLSPCLSFIRDN